MGVGPWGGNQFLRRIENVVFCKYSFSTREGPTNCSPNTHLRHPHTNVKESFQYANLRVLDIFTSALGFTIAAIGAQAFIQPARSFGLSKYSQASRCSTLKKD